MIISNNRKPTLPEFKSLMSNTDHFLNEDALKRGQYYSGRSGNLLEDDVVVALNASAVGTSFENTIQKISGQKFPDIIAGGYYGVEVKSTVANHWTSTGSSIMESTRMSDVERIYMTFGKLGGDPVEFISKPYEECLSGIAVTHMPRYLINMELNKGESIFDKIGIPYDELRQMENPVSPVSAYYRSQLKPGESLWWAGDSTDEAVSATIRLWKNVPADERNKIMLFACLKFPEVFGGNYDQYTLWLVSQGIVDPHIRDQFSAGGREPMNLSSGKIVKFPAIYRRIKNNRTEFITLISNYPQPLASLYSREEKARFAQGDELKDRIINWATEASQYSPMDTATSFDALTTLLLKVKL